MLKKKQEQSALTIAFMHDSVGVGNMCKLNKSSYVLKGF